MFSSYRIDYKTNNNGSTLRMQLRLDTKHLQLRMELKYCATQRAEFADASCPIKRLVVKHRDEVIDPMAEALIDGLQCHRFDLVAE